MKGKLKNSEWEGGRKRDRRGGGDGKGRGSKGKMKKTRWES